MTPLAIIINQIFNTGKFPEQHKIAKVIPVFNKDDNLQFNNYRPISLLPVLSKVVEQALCNHLTHFFSNKQLAFRKPFKRYINDFPLASRHFNFIMYADDTTLYSTIEYPNNDTIERIQTKINKEPSKIKHWLKINKLSLNLRKSKHMILKKTTSNINLTIKTDDIVIERVECFNFNTHSLHGFLLKSVCRCSQTTGRNSCSIVSGDISNSTVRIVWQYILSRVRVSVWPSIFLYAKNTQTLGQIGPPVPVFYFNGQRPAIVTSGAGRRGWLAKTHRIAIRRQRYVCVGGGGGVHAFARVRACVRPFVCLFVCACVRAWCVCNIR